MNDKQFDDIIKNRLANHGSPVPSGMWERITAKESKRNGPPFRRLFFLLILLVFLAFVKIYFFPNSNEELFSKEERKDKQERVNNSVAADSKIKSTSKNETTNRESTALNPSDHVSDSKVLKEAVANNVIKDSVDGEKSVTRIDRHRSSHQGSKRFSAIKKGVVTASSRNAQSNKESQPDTFSDDTKTLDDSALVKKEAKENPAEVDSTATTESSRANGEGDKFYLELYAGPAMPVNQINATTKAYEQVLKGAISSRLSFTIGARFKYEFSKRVSAKIGVQYTQLNEKMIVDDSTAAYNFSSINRYKNVGVPLLLSYKTAVLPDLPVTINTGIILTISSRQKGFIPASSGQPIDIKNDNVYSRNASVQLYLSLDASTRIGNKTELFAEPWLSYQTKSIVNRMYAFNQKIHVIGLVVGVRHQLFKIDNR